MNGGRALLAALSLGACTTVPPPLPTDPPALSPMAVTAPPAEAAPLPDDSAESRARERSVAQRAAGAGAEPSAPRAVPAEFAATFPRDCGFPEPKAVGHLKDRELIEISGVVASRKQPGVLYVHNDSGDSARFFAIDYQGELLATIDLAVPFVIDVEDIALGPGANASGPDYVYVGDIGNNFARDGFGIPRSDAIVYRVAEPQIARGSRGAKLAAKELSKISLTFPDRPRDSEALMVDPRSGDLYLVSKESDGASLVLRAAAAEVERGHAVLQKVALLQFGRPPLTGNAQPTAGDISADGSKIVLRTYSSIFLFERGPTQSVAGAFSEGLPRTLVAPGEPQGESIGFVGGTAGIITISEGKNQPIFCERLQ